MTKASVKGAFFSAWCLLPTGSEPRRHAVKSIRTLILVGSGAR
jgi:hypothetical protein